MLWFFVILRISQFSRIWLKCHLLRFRFFRINVRNYIFNLADLVVTTCHWNIDNRIWWIHWKRLFNGKLTFGFSNIMFIFSLIASLIETNQRSYQYFDLLIIIFGTNWNRAFLHVYSNGADIERLFFISIQNYSFRNFNFKNVIIRNIQVYFLKSVQFFHENFLLIFYCYFVLISRKGITFSLEKICWETKLLHSQWKPFY